MISDTFEFLFHKMIDLIFNLLFEKYCRFYFIVIRYLITVIGPISDFMFEQYDRPYFRFVIS